VLSDVDDDAACFEALFAHFARPESWRCDPSAEFVLRHLTALGLTVGVASNFDSRLRRVLAGLPELKLLSHVIISSDVGWRKPSPAFFESMIREVHQWAGSILYVGDEFENDCQGARAAGINALLFDPKARHDDASLGRIQNLEETIDWIESGRLAP
jgi:putative hydrolase of the HAD superfamily